MRNKLNFYFSPASLYHVNKQRFKREQYLTMQCKVRCRPHCSASNQRAPRWTKLPHLAYAFYKLPMTLSFVQQCFVEKVTTFKNGCSWGSNENEAWPTPSSTRGTSSSLAVPLDLQAWRGWMFANGYREMKAACGFRFWVLSFHHSHSLLNQRERSLKQNVQFPLETSRLVSGH